MEVWDYNDYVSAGRPRLKNGDRIINIPDGQYMVYPIPLDDCNPPECQFVDVNMCINRDITLIGQWGCQLPFLWAPQHNNGLYKSQLRLLDASKENPEIAAYDLGSLSSPSRTTVDHINNCCYVISRTSPGCQVAKVLLIMANKHRIDNDATSYVNSNGELVIANFPDPCLSWKIYFDNHGNYWHTRYNRLNPDYNDQDITFQDDAPRSLSMVSDDPVSESGNSMVSNTRSSGGVSDDPVSESSVSYDSGVDDCLFDINHIKTTTSFQIISDMFGTHNITPYYHNFPSYFGNILPYDDKWNNNGEGFADMCELKQFASSILTHLDSLTSNNPFSYDPDQRERMLRFIGGLTPGVMKLDVDWITDTLRPLQEQSFFQDICNEFNSYYIVQLNRNYLPYSASWDNLAESLNDATSVKSFAQTIINELNTLNSANPNILNTRLNEMGTTLQHIINRMQSIIDFDVDNRVDWANESQTRFNHISIRFTPIDPRWENDGAGFTNMTEIRTYMSDLITYFFGLSPEARDNFLRGKGLTYNLLRQNFDWIVNFSHSDADPGDPTQPELPPDHQPPDINLDVLPAGTNYDPLHGGHIYGYWAEAPKAICLDPTDGGIWVGYFFTQDIFKGKLYKFSKDGELMVGPLAPPFMTHFYGMNYYAGHLVLNCPTEVAPESFTSLNYYNMIRNNGYGDYVSGLSVYRIHDNTWHNFLPNNIEHERIYLYNSIVHGNTIYGSIWKGPYAGLVYRRSFNDNTHSIIGQGIDASSHRQRGLCVRGNSLYLANSDPGARVLKVNLNNGQLEKIIQLPEINPDQYQSPVIGVGVDVYNNVWCMGGYVGYHIIDENDTPHYRPANNVDNGHHYTYSDFVGRNMFTEDGRWLV